MRRLELFVVHPFWLPFVPRREARDRSGRRARWAAELTRAGAGAWEVFDLPRSYPVTLRHRYGGVLRRPATPDPALLALAERHLAELEATAVEAESGVWYLGDGLGGVDLHVRFDLPDGVDGAAVNRVGEALRQEARDGGIPRFADHDALVDALRRAMDADGGTEEGWLRAAFDRRPGFTGAYGFDLMATVPDGHVDDRLLALGTAFCGLLEERGAGRAMSGGLAWVQSGFDGQVAVVTDADAAERVRWLWRWVTLYWGVESEAADTLFEHLSALADVADGDDWRAERDDANRLRATRRRVGFLFRPESVVGDEVDRAVYGGAWKAWDGDRVVALATSLDDQVGKVLIDLDLAQRERAAHRISVVANVIALLTLVSTVADVAGLLDYDQALLGRVGRSALLVVSVLLVAWLARTTLTDRQGVAR